MPLKKDETVNADELSSVLLHAAQRNAALGEKWGFRVEVIDALENELISSANDSKLKLSSNPSLLECITIQNHGQSSLNRLTEIELESMRIETVLSASQTALMNSILSVLGSNGSAESRKAKAYSAMETINLLLSLEQGLLRITDVVRKNLQSAIGTASRAQTALQHEIQYLGGADIAKELMDEFRKGLVK